MENGKLKFGISLYSFSDSFYTRELDIEGCIRRAKELGYTGVTLVAAQSAREYPFISDEWLYRLRDIMEKYEMEPVCWEGYLDIGMRSDRDMNQEELAEYTRNDIVYAKKAGFPMMKTQHSITPQNFEAMLPFCEKMDIKLNIEMHYPHHPHVPVWLEYFKIMEKSSGYLGACPDLSIFQKYPHQLHIDQAVEAGFREDKLEAVLSMIRNKKPMEEAEALGLNDVEKRFTDEFYHKFSNPSDIKELAPLLKYAQMLHGKFYYLGEDEYDPCIPYEEIMPILKTEQYGGYLIAEYEGHHFSIRENESQQLERYSKMTKKLYENA